MVGQDYLVFCFVIPIMFVVGFINLRTVWKLGSFLSNNKRG